MKEFWFWTGAHHGSRARNAHRVSAPCQGQSPRPHGITPGHHRQLARCRVRDSDEMTLLDKIAVALVLLGFVVVVAVFCFY